MRQITTGTFTPTALMFAYINQVLQSGQLSYGHFSQQFEYDFATLHDRQYGILSNSGTSSLLVALQTLKECHNWQDGDEVIVPALTFVATVNVVLQSGLKPVLCDVEPDYYGIDIRWLEAYITSKTRAIIPVHAFGQPCDMEAVWSIVLDYSLKVIEDSCESMLVTYKDQPVGSWSHIACFSTYMAHLVTTGVGGIALTDNSEYAKIMRSLVNHGLMYSDLSQSGKFNPVKTHRDFTFERVGHSFRITELEAAIGLAQLSDLPNIIDNRQANARYLNQALADLPLQLPKTRPHAQHAFMMYPIVCIDGNRDELTAYLNEHGIQTRRMLPLINQPVYKGLWNPNDYPIAQWIDDNGFYIGCHQDLAIEDLEYMVEVIRGYYD